MSRLIPTRRPSPEIEIARSRVMVAARALIEATERGDDGARLVSGAQVKGHRFALLLMLREGRARVDLVTAEGERTPLFRVAGATT